MTEDQRIEKIVTKKVVELIEEEARKGVWNAKLSLVEKKLQELEARINKELPDNFRARIRKK